MKVTAADLRELPLRAIVALCARNASRHRPLFAPLGSNPRFGAAMTAVDAAIRLALNYAAGRPGPDDPRSIVAAACDASKETPEGELHIPAGVIWKTADVAAVAIEGRPDMIPLIPFRAESCVGSVGRVGEAVRADYRALVALDLGTFPDPGRPVDASEAGPLGSLGCFMGD